MKMRRIVICLAALIFLFSGSMIITARENTEYSNPQTGYIALIEDNANLLKDSEYGEVLEKMREVTDYASVILLTNESYHTGSVSSFAKTRFEEICREKGKDWYNGTLFLIDMYERELYIYSGKETFRTITAAKANTITDNVYTYASQSDYLRCITEVFDQIAKVFQGQAIAQPMRFVSAGLLAVFTGLAISFILVLIFSRQKRISFEQRRQMLLSSDSNVDLRETLTGTKRTRHVESSGGGFSGGGGGGGGGGGSGGGGGGHSF